MVKRTPFKRIPIGENYFINEYGIVISGFTWKILKPLYRGRGHHYYVDIPILDRTSGRRIQKHFGIHKLVYLTWVGKIPEGLQINHYDDDKTNNHVSNLYLGTQKENINDCIRNGHRIGRITKVVVFDRKVGKEITFPTVKEFIIYAGGTESQIKATKLPRNNEFKRRFKIIKRESVQTMENYKLIRADFQSARVEISQELGEVSTVPQILSLGEAHGASNND